MTMTDNQRPVVPPTEVRPKGKRRTFSAEYKRGILAEVDACTKQPWKRIIDPGGPLGATMPPFSTSLAMVSWSMVDSG